MTFAVGVVGHTSRQTQALHLGQQVGAHTVSIDDGSLGATGNHLRTLEHLATLGSQYAVILEDDAQPVDGFADQLTQALQAAPRCHYKDGDHCPAPIVSAYLGTGYPRYWQPGIGKAIQKADALNAPWILSEHLLHAVAYAIRADLIGDLLAHQQQLPIDDMITEWARANGHQVAYVHPSICDHEDGPTVITARVERRHPRHAHRTGTRTTWTGPTTTLEY